MCVANTRYDLLAVKMDNDLMDINETAEYLRISREVLEATVEY
ncbi:MAG: hypothetical protein QME63_07735 [Actinomycetota bacterium]|nr:hypothetical protein [Actinomycetota bacterium]